MNIFSKGSRFIKRKIAQIIYFFIRDSFDEFAGNSATLQNIQELQHLISEGVNSDRFKVKEQGEELGGVKEELGEVKGAVKEQGEELGGVKDRVKEQGEELGSVKDKVKEQGEELGEVKGTVKEQGEELGSVKDRVKGQGEELGSVKDRVKGQGEELGSVKDRVKEQGEELVGVDNRIAEVQGFAEAINENLFGVRSDFKVHDEKVSDLSEFVGYSEKKLVLDRQLKEMPEINYVEFENKFRGSEELIKERQSVFLKFFGECKNVLDIGCGRGEFLELLRDNDIYATGIDIDSGMVKRCKEKGLNAIEVDVFEFLNDLKADEIDGVFCSQVVEHFSFKEIQLMLYILSKKIRKDGILLFETINPRCLPAMQHFYVDSTHVQPVDYEAFTFMAESLGFRLNASVLSSPIDNDLDPFSFKMNHIDITKYGDYALIINKN